MKYPCKRPVLVIARLGSLCDNMSCVTRLFVRVYRCPALQVQSVREIVHPTLFTRISLSESARCAPPVRVQGAKDQGMFRAS